ncbi:MAG: hypothetical protein H7Y07_00010 [Pyrinomonadaceae bacterium]|nr:hypothetical protein [Sphingobacteriaceae bacterium]
MTNRIFFHHQYTAFWRSKNTGKSMAVSIFKGLSLLYLFANLLIVSFFLDKILDKAIPERETIDAFNCLLIYYFLIDLLMRFQLQELPTLSVKPYLNLPISRNKIVKYLSLTSLFTGFNLSPFLLTVPFLLKVLLFEGDGTTFFALVISIAGLTLLNHFFSVWLKRKININAWFVVGFLCVLAGIMLADFYLNTVSIFSFSGILFDAIIHHPYLALLPILLAFGMYLINHKFLKSNLYLDELYKENASERSTAEFSFLSRFGMAGQLAALELKLILRNKRPRSTLITSMVFMLYGLIFYPTRSHDSSMSIFAGLMMTGMFIINYGQFMFSWQSAHFDGVLASNISPKDFFKSKFLLFTLLSTITLILTTPYVYFGWDVLLAHAMLYLWNIGVSSLIILAFANWNYKYIDLSKGSSFNWEGVGASQWIVGIPLFVLPMGVYQLIKWWYDPTTALLILGFIGLAFILSRSFWLNKLLNAFTAKRYVIAEGFRTR